MVEPPKVKEVGSFVEEALSRSEMIWRELATSEVVEMIPVIRRFVQGWGAIQDIRNALLAAKLRAFILEPSLQTPEAREAMRERASTDEGRQIGETLFMVLERLTDRMKPVWLGRLFAGYLSNDLTGSELRRLAMTVDTAFGDDLLELIKVSDESLQTMVDYSPWRQYLVPAGLFDERIAPIGGRTTYRITPLGEKFRIVVRKYSKE